MIITGQMEVLRKEAQKRGSCHRVVGCGGAEVPAKAFQRNV